MTDFWIAPDLFFDGQDMVTGKAIRVQSGRIVDIDMAPTSASKLTGIVSPGFVDLQVNGGGGALFNTSPTRTGIVKIAKAHRTFGTVAILPTLITDHPDLMDQGADAVIAAQHDDGIIGIHIEGPHIAEARRGTHNAAFVRNMDERTLATVQRLRAENVDVMITLAPEAVEPAQIQRLAQMGAVVSIGHTDATAAQIDAALRDGASCATHLFNAMSPMLGRAPGAVGAIINADCYTGIICDGHHVADDMVGLAIRARPVPDKMFLVSDAMATVGGPDHFDLYGQRVHLKDGRLINQEGGLAGAHVTQHQGLRRLASHVGVTMETAFRMAITTPAACIRQPMLGQLYGRKLEDVLHLSPDLTQCMGLTDALSKANLVDAE